MSAWLVILAAGAGSYLLRLSMVARLGRDAPPPTVERLARYVAPAAFAAMAATGLAGAVEKEGAGATPPLAVLAAVAVGLVVARLRSSRLALGAGMATLWVVAALAPGS